MARPFGGAGSRQPEHCTHCRNRKALPQSPVFLTVLQSPALLKTFFQGCFAPCAPGEPCSITPWWPLHTATPASIEVLLMGQRMPIPRTFQPILNLKWQTLLLVPLTEQKPTLETPLHSTMVKTNGVNREGPCSPAPPGPSLGSSRTCFFLYICHHVPTELHRVS